MCLILAAVMAVMWDAREYWMDQKILGAEGKAEVITDRDIGCRYKSVRCDGVLDWSLYYLKVMCGDP